MQIVKVWGEDLPKLREKIINLWVNEGVLNREEANKRVNEVICAALDDNLEVMAICSGNPIYSEQLKEWFLYYRHFTNTKFRNNKFSLITRNVNKNFFGFFSNLKRCHYFIILILNTPLAGLTEPLASFIHLIVTSSTSDTKPTKE